VIQRGNERGVGLALAVGCLNVVAQIAYQFTPRLKEVSVRQLLDPGQLHEPLPSTPIAQPMQVRSMPWQVRSRLVLRRSVGGIPTMTAKGHVDQPVPLTPTASVDELTACVIVRWVVEPGPLRADYQEDECRPAAAAG
jgi:hypothetical protein